MSNIEILAGPSEQVSIVKNDRKKTELCRMFLSHTEIRLVIAAELNTFDVFGSRSGIVQGT